MAKLIYFTISSLDGYIADDGNYDWSAPDEATFAFIVDLLRPIRTYLCGRRNYETMTVWETPDLIPGITPPMREFAHIWQAAEKIVFSQTRETAGTPNSRLERQFEPDMVRHLKEQLPHALSVSGPTLAAQAIRGGLVDEIHLLVVPAMLGGGIRVLPSGVRLTLDLLEERRFDRGWVYLRYRVHT